MPPNTKHPHHSSVASSYLTAALDAAIYAKQDDEEGAGSSFPVLMTTASNTPSVDTIRPPASNTYDDYDGSGFLDHHPDIEAEENHSSTLKSYSIMVEQQEQQERIHHDQQHEHQKVRTILRKYSSTVQDLEQCTLDEKRIQHALSDAGKHVYGIQGISVWMFDEDNDRLVLPPGGFWFHAANQEPSDALDTAMDQLRHDSPHPSAITPVAPGTDIAGLLWLEESNHHHFWQSPHHMVPPDHTSFLHPIHHHHHSPQKKPPLDVDSIISRNQREPSHASTTTTSLVWRDLKSLVQDPDIAKGPSLLLLEQAGFGKAAGISFHAGVCSGLVIFFVQPDLDPNLLNSTVHTIYLYQAAHFIGTAAALTEARRATIGQQMHQTKSTVGSSDDERNTNETRVSALDAQGAKNNEVLSEAISHSPTCSSLTRKRLHAWLSKIQGGGLQVPPALSTRQSLWTTFGAFCGLMVLAALNKIYMTLSDDYYFLLVEPFGALMTLQYGLTAAPASQPRNAIMGQAVAGAVSLSFTYIPEYILAEWLRRVIGPAIAIGVMVKLGFTHPPAGAHAIVYSSGKYNFSFYALVVLSTVVSTIPATLVNNMSRKRQYPTFWGFPSFLTNRASGRSKGTGRNT